MRWIYDILRLFFFFHINCFIASSTPALLGRHDQVSKHQQNVAFLQYKHLQDQFQQNAVVSTQSRHSLPVGWHQTQQVSFVPDPDENTEQAQDEDEELGADNADDSVVTTERGSINEEGKAENTEAPENDEHLAGDNAAGSAVSTAHGPTNDEDQQIIRLRTEVQNLWSSVRSQRLWIQTYATISSIATWSQNTGSAILATPTVQLYVLPFMTQLEVYLVNGSKHISDSVAASAVGQWYAKIQKDYLDDLPAASSAKGKAAELDNEIYSKAKEDVDMLQKDPSYLSFLATVFFIMGLCQCCCHVREDPLSQKSKCRMAQNSKPCPHPLPSDIVDVLENSSLDEFRCPISHFVMSDPVILSDGHTYDRPWISKWLATNKTSPMTRERLSGHDLIPNFNLRQQMQRVADEMRQRT